MSDYQRMGKSWLPLHKRVYPSGKASYMVATMLDGRRIRQTFTTIAEAEGFREYLRADKRGQQLGGAVISPERRLEAIRGQEALAAHGWTIEQAAEYCLTHVIPYQCAPTISQIVERMIIDAQEAKRKAWTLHERKSRLAAFAQCLEIGN